MMTPIHPSQRPLDETTEIAGRRVRVWRTEDAKWHVRLTWKDEASGSTCSMETGDLPSLHAALEHVRAAIGGEGRV